MCLEKDPAFYVTACTWYAGNLLANCQYVQISLELVENLMQIMHNTLIFLCDSACSVYFKFHFDFLKTFLCLAFFYHFLGFFQGNFWGFLHNRMATLVTIGEQKISPKSGLKKNFLPTPITQDQTPSDFDNAGLVVVAVFKINSKYIGTTRSLATRRTLGIPKLLKCINKAQPEPRYKKTQLLSRSHAYENRELRSRSHFIFTITP